MYLKRKGTDSLKTYTVGRGGSLELEGNGLPSSSDGRGKILLYLLYAITIEIILYVKY